MAVVAAVELDDLLASGERARQPDRGQRGLGTRVDEADHLDRGEGLADQLGQLDLAPGRRAEAAPDEQRVAPDRFEGANGAVDAARQERNGALVEGVRALSPWSGHRAS